MSNQCYRCVYRLKRNSKGFHGQNLKIETNDVNANLSEQFNTIDNLNKTGSITPEANVPARKLLFSAQGERQNHSNKYKNSASNMFGSVINNRFATFDQSRPNLPLNK